MSTLGMMHREEIRAMVSEIDETTARSISAICAGHVPQGECRLYERASETRFRNVLSWCSFGMVSLDAVKDALITMALKLDKEQVEARRAIRDKCRRFLNYEDTLK